MKKLKILKKILEQSQTILAGFYKKMSVMTILCCNSFRNAKCPESFGQFARNSEGTVRVHKISTPENLVKLQCITQAASRSDLTKGQTELEWYQWNRDNKHLSFYANPSHEVL